MLVSVIIFGVVVLAILIGIAIFLEQREEPDDGDKK